MDFFVSTKHRTDKEELMDDFSIGGELLRDTLNKLERINRWLGGNTVTINGLRQVLQNKPKENTYRIVDLGCGHGDILRDAAKWGRKNGYQFQLVGIDANPTAIAYAEELSVDYPELSFQTEDIFSRAFQKKSFDIVLTTLFLHHFKEKELISILENSIQKTSLAIIVNDLHRNKLAYYLFMMLSIFIKNKMIIEDGLTSVLRGFKRNELEKMSSNLHAKSTITWKWAFRFLWIIQK